VTVKKGAVLGSGSLAPEDFTLPVGSVWVGAQDGCAVLVAPEDRTYATRDTTTPFGRAFYQGKAAFTVIPLWGVVAYNTLWQAFCTW
jgi:carbonic anhydrase/acetyltransferase-like protein (isoleucine patch superfamily)